MTKNITPTYKKPTNLNISFLFTLSFIKPNKFLSEKRLVNAFYLFDIARLINFLLVFLII